MTQFAKIGYRCSRVSASGQRKGARKGEKCIAGDLIALAPDGSALPHVIAEIGGAGKRIRRAFAEMTAEPLTTGFVPMVGRVVKRKWAWYASPHARHKTLKAALQALRKTVSRSSPPARRRRLVATWSECVAEDT